MAPPTPQAAASPRWRGSSKRSSQETDAGADRDWEFIDIGCGNGRSTDIIVKKLNVRGKGLGIDTAKDKLAQDTAQLTFREGDALALSNRKQCQFVTMFNVLPTLPTFAAALSLLRKACMICRDFVYVSQPNFEGNVYLLRLGMKTHYSDSASNRFQGTSADYSRMVRTLLNDGLIADFSIVESGAIADPSDDVIHPLQTPPDSGRYNPAQHRFKSTGNAFREPVYRRLQLILTRKPAQLAPISKRLASIETQDNVVLSSVMLD
jgi:SAM-dependent methyltransferase